MPQAARGNLICVLPESPGNLIPGLPENRT